MERGSCNSNGSDAAVAAATAAAPRKTKIEIVQQRFKADEQVHQIFEVYQFRGQEQVEGLLALVSSASGGTYAIISFKLLRNPLIAANDLKIVKVYPINNSFKLEPDKKEPMYPQFFLSTDDDKQNKYCYYPAVADFNTFCAEVFICKDSIGFPHDEATLNFKWLDAYREIGEVKQELKKRENQYIVYKDITIYCATWNVNNKSCSISDSLRPWLDRSTKAPDIYAIGLQELDTTTRAMLNANQTQSTADKWVQLMAQSLPERVEYEELQSIRFYGIMLTVFVRRELRPKILHCPTASVARGILHKLGNKGGVGISVQLQSASICFVNSHLAAHQGYVAERNDDYRGIEEWMRFEVEGMPGRSISEHDHIFWLGDLNYRVNQRTEEPYLGLPDTRSIEQILEDDQLRLEMRDDRCFRGYTEGDIRFNYTYKYEIGSNKIDPLRAPAYCDRVLWKGQRIEQLAYNCVMEIQLSDHKPVYAIFSVKIKMRDEAKYKSVQDEVLKAVDKRENDNQPQIIAERTLIDFGKVRFNEPYTRDFTVSNNCPQQVEFKFKVKDSPRDICEKWLNVDPSSDSLMIDSARSIRLRMLVDANSITGLLEKICQNRCKFDFDILILNVRCGRDIFITVTGEYQPSCFGLSMETLCRTERPLCEYNQEEVKLLMKDERPVYRVTMPREFFLLIDYLHKQGDRLNGIFQSFDRKQPLSSDFNTVRDWLDTWSDDEFPGTPQIAAEALLLLLDLPDQALLQPFVDDLLRSRTDAEAMDLIVKLTPPKRNVVMHLRMFLREGIERNHYKLSNVAVIFGRILLRSNSCNLTIDYEARCTDFMRRFIYIETGDTIS